MRTFALVLVFALIPNVAFACEASTGGARSFERRVSPRSGIFCFYLVTEYEGGTCEAGREIARTDEGCSRLQRLALTDEGVFVSIAAPRTSRRAWTILRVFTIGDGARTVDVSLEDLSATAPLRGVVRVSFDQGAVMFRDAATEARVTFAELAARL
jgi:hypothetical protein